MQLRPSDIASFGYCPYLYWRRGTAQVVPPLSTFEDTVRRSILAAEMKALKNGTHVTSRSLGNAWERTWWTAAAAAGIEFAEAEKISLRAAFKFSDYCKYDISSSLFATIGATVPFQVKLPHAVLAGEIDMIKLPIDDSDKRVTLIDFGRKGVTRTQLASDLAVLSTVYAFQELGREITYMCVDLSDGTEKLKIVSSSFDRESIKETERTIQYLAEGIYRGVNYKSGWMCGECTKCASKF